MQTLRIRCVTLPSFAAQGIIRQVLHKYGTVGMSTGVHKQCIAIGWRVRDEGRSLRAASTGMVFDRHRLPPNRRELLTDSASYYINAAASPERLDHADGFRGELLFAEHHPMRYLLKQVLFLTE